MPNYGLLISEKAHLKLRYAAELMPSDEVSGFGRTVDRGDGFIELVDIIIPPQEVGGAHVDISADVQAAFYVEAIRNGCDGEDCKREHPAPTDGDCTTKMCSGHARKRASRHDDQCHNGDIKDYRVWWHKHPGTSKPSPSGVDEKTLSDFASKDGWKYGWMIGLIISQDGSNAFAWLNLEGPWMLEQKDIPITYASHRDEAVKAAVKAQLEHVSKRPAYTGRSYGRRADGTYGPMDGEQSSYLPSKPSTGRQPSGTGAKDDKRLPINFSQVVSMCPSDDTPHHVDILTIGGATVVAEDRSGYILSEWKKHLANAERGGIDKRLKSKMNASLMEARRSLNKGYGKANNRKAGSRVIDRKPKVDELFMGFDADGGLVARAPGNEKLVKWNLDFSPATPAVRKDDGTFVWEDAEGKLIITQDMGLERYVLGPEFIGWGGFGEPLVKGEEDELWYGPDGKRIFDDEEGDVDIALLRAKYGVPGSLPDDMVLEYADMALALEDR